MNENPHPAHSTDRTRASDIHLNYRVACCACALCTSISPIQTKREIATRSCNDATRHDRTPHTDRNIIELTIFWP